MLKKCGTPTLFIYSIRFEFLSKPDFGYKDYLLYSL